MYYYIVNPNAGNRSFADIQHKLKSQLNRLGIDGEFAKTLDSTDSQKIARAALKRDVKTIVVAGGDKTINEVITAVHESGKKSVAIGIIPLGNKNTLAGFLGINNWQQACELLAARRLQSFNIIHINDYNFIRSCQIEPKDDDSAEALVEINGSFKLRGQFAGAHVTNQKIQNPNLPNQLLLQFYPPSEPLRWWSRLSKPSTASAPTQLQSRVAILEYPSKHTALIDGRKFEDKLFRIRLSEVPIQLITAKQESF